MQVIDLKWFASNRLIFSSDGVLTEPSYQNKLYNMTVLKTHKTVFTGSKQSLGIEQFPALPSTYLPWVGCCLLFYQRRVLLCSIPRLRYQEAKPHLAEKLGAVARLGVKRGNGNERERERGAKESLSLPLLPTATASSPSSLFVSPPNQDGPVSQGVPGRHVVSRGLLRVN